MNNLKDKIIIVTGGSGLIGNGIVSKIRSEAGFCINAELNVENTDDLTQIKCDITNPDSISLLVENVLTKFGRIDGLVNNAYPRTKDWGTKFEDIPYDSWRNNLDWQLNSYFLFCQKVLVPMKKQGFGSIVNIASTYGVVSPDFTLYEGTQLTSPAAYTAIKGGLINFTRYLASYFGKDGIRANCVSPGGIFDNQNEIFVKNYQHKVPLKRMGKPSDIAGPVAFLLSDDSAYVTGHNLMADGGWTCI
jgi:NAD(P)-dependent dehydrogenase (short-subunit alcohol dehydrogenase family)